jgi:hypothetical protein
MTDLSTIKEEQIVKSVDGTTAIRYKVVEEVIDLEALRQEKEELQAIAELKEPTVEELIELAKQYHEYYLDKNQIRNRIAEINLLLK